MSNESSAKIGIDGRGGVWAHIPSAVVAAVVATVFLGGDKLYSSSRQSVVVPADVLSEVQSLRREEERRMRQMEQRIDAMNIRIQWLEGRVYGTGQRTNLEPSEEENR